MTKDGQFFPRPKKIQAAANWEWGSFKKSFSGLWKMRRGSFFKKKITLENPKTPIAMEKGLKLSPLSPLKGPLAGRARGTSETESRRSLQVSPKCDYGADRVFL